ncbi:MAG TPA: hypothetical protein VM598_02085 [Bdellovibrionota bacterium]|nr:hypothetical protein [Bdellovibrionota bacterium]
MTRFFVFLSLLLSGCTSGPGIVETGNPKLYISTTGEGDLGVWQVESGAFSLEWQVAAPFTGEISYAYRVSGTCSSASDYGFRPCTLVAASCEARASACPGSIPAIGDTYELLELPGVALFAYAAAQTRLHIGVLRASCDTEISGDFTYLNSALNRQEVFGQFRTDSSLQDIVRSAFSFRFPGTPSLFYYGSGTGQVSVTGEATCADGVRTIPTGTAATRATVTESGLLLLSYPFPFGGAFAFRTDQAAEAAELANKTFLGYVFKEGGGSTMARLRTGARSGGGVAYASLEYRTGSQPDLTGHFIQDVPDIGSAYGFDGVPPSFFGGSYADNLLSSSYPTPAQVPGLLIDRGGTGADNFTLLTAMRTGTGKLLVFSTTMNSSGGIIKTVGTAAYMEQ